MAQTPSILGQNFPDPDVDTNLFTVPTNNMVQFSVFVANHANLYDRITIALVPAGGVEIPANYIAFETPLMPNACIAFSGLHMNSQDKIIVKSKNGSSSFVATGVLTTP